jgi:hypothetical protein
LNAGKPSVGSDPKISGSVCPNAINGLRGQPICETKLASGLILPTDQSGTIGSDPQIALIVFSEIVYPKILKADLSDVPYRGELDAVKSH